MVLRIRAADFKTPISVRIKCHAESNATWCGQRLQLLQLLAICLADSSVSWVMRKLSVWRNFGLAVRKEREAAEGGTELTFLLHLDPSGRNKTIYILDRPRLLLHCIKPIAAETRVLEQPRPNSCWKRRSVTAHFEKILTRTADSYEISRRDDPNRCHIVCVKFRLIPCRSVVDISRFSEGSLFPGHTVHRVREKRVWSISLITSSITGRFSKFFNSHNLLKICNKAIIKYSTTP